MCLISVHQAQPQPLIHKTNQLQLASWRKTYALHAKWQAIPQDLNAKGFQIVQSGANANVIVNVRKFYATVEQGNILYKVNAEVNVEVAVKGAKGHFNKNFNATRGYEGAALTTDNDDIKSVLSQAYQDVVKSIYNDNEIANAIHQYK